MKTRCLFLLLIFFLYSLTGQAQSTAPTDTRFGDKGAVFLNLCDSVTELQYIDQDIDSKGNLFVLASRGYYSAIGGQRNDAVLIKLTPAGGLDSSFWENGIRNIGYGWGTPQFIRVSTDQNAVYLFNDEFTVRLKPNGQLDSSFGNNGRLRETSFNTTHVMVTPDNGYLRGQMFQGTYAVPNGASFELRKYTAQGKPDPTFNSNGKFIFRRDGKYNPAQLMFLKNGDMLLSGVLADIAPSSPETAALIKIKKTGTLDSSFGTNGIARDLRHMGYYSYPNTYSGRTFLLPDSSVLMIRAVTYYGPLHLFKFLKDGQVDTTFSDKGHEVNNYFKSTFGDFLGRPKNPSMPHFWFSPGLDGFRYAVCKVKPDGHLDSTSVRYSDPPGTLFNSGFTAFRETSIITDSQLVNSYMIGINGLRNNSTLRSGKMNTNAQMDSTYGINGKSFVQNYASIEFLISLVPARDNKMIGLANTIEGSTFLFRLKADGTRDSNFGSKGLVKINRVDPDSKLANGQLSIDSRNRIIVFSAPSVDTLRVERFTNEGRPDSSFAVNGRLNIKTSAGYKMFVKGLVQPDDKLLILSSDLMRPNTDEFDVSVMRVNSNGSIDKTFGVNGQRTVDLATDFFTAPPVLGTNSDLADNMLLLKDGNLLVAAKRLDVSGYYLFKLDKAGNIIRTGGQTGRVLINGGPESKAFFLAEDNLGRILYSQDHYSQNVYNGTSTYRLNKDLTQDAQYRPSVVPYVRNGSPVVFGSGQLMNNGELYLAAQTRSTDGNYELLVACVKPDGGIDSVKGENGLIKFTRHLPAFSTFVNPLYQYDLVSTFRDSSGQLITAFTAYKNQFDDIFITRNIVNDITPKTDTSGSGFGQLTLWTKKLCTGGAGIQVELDNSKEILNNTFSSAPACGASGALAYTLRAGTYQIKAYCITDTLVTNITIKPGQCIVKEIAMATGNRNPSNGNIGLQPNPASTICYVSLDDTDAGTIRLLDQNGKEVLRQNFNGQTTPINVSKLERGTYVVEVIGNKFQGHKLLVKM